MSRAAVGGWLVRLVSVAGLGVDAVIHADLASGRPPGGTISQGDLFCLEAVVAVLAAVVVLLTGARVAYAFAVLVAATALGAVVLYRYLDVGALGPLPDLYEPFWSASKLATAVAEAVALTAAAIGTVLPLRRRRSGCARLLPDHAGSAPR